MLTSIMLSTTLCGPQIESSITSCKSYKAQPSIVRSIDTLDISRYTLGNFATQLGAIRFSSLNGYSQLSEEDNIINTMVSNDLVVMMEPKNKYKIKIKVGKVQKAIPNLIDFEGIYE